MGTRVSPDAYPGWYGTKGLYLHTAPANPQAWDFEPCVAALTCRHIILKGVHDVGTVYRDDASPEAQLFVNQETGAEMDIAKEIEAKIQNERRTREDVEMYMLRQPNRQRDASLRILEYAAHGARREASMARRAQQVLKYTHGTSIRMGHLLFAQEYSAALPFSATVSSPETAPSFSVGPWLRDYALVQIDKGICTRRVRNRLPMTWEFICDEAQTRNGVAIPPGAWGVDSENEAVLSTEIVPEREILMFYEAKKPVGKLGAASGLTFGVVNNLKSLVRHPHFVDNDVVNVKDVPTWEICVVNPMQKQAGPVASHQLAFARGSDSGAAVWDMTGRAVGILTGGVGGELVDTTYVTSLERILDDMKSSGIKARIL